MIKNSKHLKKSESSFDLLCELSIKKYFSLINISFAEYLVEILEEIAERIEKDESFDKSSLPITYDGKEVK